MPKLGVSSGISIIANFGEHLGIETGLQYSNKQLATHSGLMFWNTEFGIAEGEWSHNFNYIDIPVKLNYYIGKGMNRFMITAGVTTSFLQNYNIQWVTYGGHPYESKFSAKKYANTRYNFYTFGVGVLEQLNDRLSLRILPTFSIANKDILKTQLPTEWHVTSAERLLWNTGVEVGLLYDLNGNSYNKNQQVNYLWQKKGISPLGVGMGIGYLGLLEFSVDYLFLSHFSIEANINFFDNGTEGLRPYSHSLGSNIWLFNVNNKSGISPFTGLFVGVLERYERPIFPIIFDFAKVPLGISYFTKFGLQTSIQLNYHQPFKSDYTFFDIQLKLGWRFKAKR
ncbi:MAG: hypothetical protein BGO29_07110 [Bacteroidales bacterium 36-12]|nr:MAG: hypothetical protein BGO29_07110 [Bacteroidales bacterium 36-12]